MGSVGDIYRQEVTPFLLNSLRAVTFVRWGFPVGGDKVTTHSPQVELQSLVCEYTVQCVYSTWAGAQMPREVPYGRRLIRAQMEDMNQRRRGNNQSA